MKRFALFGFLVVSLTVPLAIGCSSEPARGTVSGSVLYEGKPAVGGIITFMPKSGDIPVSAEIDGKGNYSAENVLAGDVLVSVISAPDDTATLGEKMKQSGAAPEKGPVRTAPPASKYPARYSEFGTSQLTTNVKPIKEGVTNFDVKLTK